MVTAKPESTGRRIWISILLLIGLLLLSTVIASIIDDGSANTAIIRITGPIVGDSDNSLFSSTDTSSTDVVKYLEKARDDGSIKAVILEINSPGGSAVASDEIGQAVKDVRAQNKTVVAWIREEGASGAYWIASSSDHIIANRMSITGSIGVISSYLQFDEFLKEWNVSYNRLVSGENKDIGDPFTNLSADKRAILQGKLDKVHGFFIDEVASNRNMSRAKVAELADGSFFLGVEAKNLGLVDELGGKTEAINYIQNKTGITVSTVTYEPEQTFLSRLFGLFSGAPKQNLAAQQITQTMQSDSPVPMLR